LTISIRLLVNDIKIEHADTFLQPIATNYFQTVLFMPFLRYFAHETD